MRSLYVSSVLALPLLACGGNEPGVSLAVAVPQTSALVHSSSADGLVLADSSDELVIASAEVVLREIEFGREDDSLDCDDDDDSCEEFDAGPRLVSLPLDGNVDVQLTAEIPEGTYDEIELDVHKVSDSDNPAFIEQHPDLLHTSVRVRGAWNGEEFTFTSDLDEEQELELATPIVVAADGSEIGVTLSLDLATWFVDGSGNLVDPRTANEGGANQGLVEENIKRSIDGFEDDDRDGVEDDDEEDD